ncbi:Serine/threonine-protein kinase TAO3 [Fagus crenata]
MGNCQAIDAAALVIQHPSGRIERLYWQVSASEVMKMNPGHYVSLIIPLPVSEEENQEQKATVRFTRVKLLRPNDTLTLGHAYRLVTTQEVVKVLRAKKNAKMKKQQPESAEKSQTVPEKPSSGCEEEGNSDKEKTYQAMRHERHRTRTTPMNPAAMRSKSWRPSLQSISEATS